MNSIETDIYIAIDMAFNWFKKNNPSLDIICDEETMNQWYDFVTWCYAQDGECMAEDELKNNPNFNFEISPLMQSAMNECDAWWCKYNVDHQAIAEEEFSDDEDEEAHWEAYEDAFYNISNSVDTSCFEKLSKIVL